MGFRPIDLQIALPRSGEVNKVQNNQGSQFNQEFAQQQEIQLAKQKQKQVNESNKSEGNTIGKHKEKNSQQQENSEEKDKNKEEKKDKKLLFDPAKGRYIDINI